MKKIITLLAVIGMFGFQSCEGPEGPPGVPGQDGIGAAAFDIVNQDLFKENDNVYSVSNTFSDEVGSDLHGSDMVLIYRKSGSTNTNLPVWQLIPRSIYFPNGDVLDYDFDFTVKDYIITANGNYALLNRPDYVLGQTFRVLIVPNELLSSINKNNYNEVISALKINENEINKIDL
ncbi:hypothetical protein [Flavobacterium taihuense]|uniref:Collagen-like protein n=1 Tax=Flavobacterium taihuense TaxID=2857508 RepID=A0ABS6XVP8_9FLAO|nr:hypothetical protein [Flavobacterium taihuense]MBW4359944.1 hypothetical protein [Flavobacterium taihuense]